MGIDRVEVSFDDLEAVRATNEFVGEWNEVELGDVESNETWVQWRYDWDAAPGDHLIRVRATDTTGFRQSPIIVNPAPDGAEGYHTVAVRAV